MEPRTNFDKSLSVVTALTRDPAQSNAAIAKDCGVAEFVVRRHRKILELTSIIAVTTVRLGADGREYSLPRERARA